MAFPFSRMIARQLVELIFLWKFPVRDKQSNYLAQFFNRKSSLDTTLETLLKASVSAWTLTILSVKRDAVYWRNEDTNNSLICPFCVSVIMKMSRNQVFFYNFCETIIMTRNIDMDTITAKHVYEFSDIAISGGIIIAAYIEGKSESLDIDPFKKGGLLLEQYYLKNGSKQL